MFDTLQDNSGALVVDGEFVRIYKNKPRMTIRVWVHYAEKPNERINQTEISARSTSGPVSMASVTMNNLAHNTIAYLNRNLPVIIEEQKRANRVRSEESSPPK